MPVISGHPETKEDALATYDNAKANLEMVRELLIGRLAAIEKERAEIKAKLGRTRTRKAKTAK